MGWHASYESVTFHHEYLYAALCFSALQRYHVK